MKRLVFWVVFLAVVGVLFVYTWRTNDPLRNNPYLLPLWVRYQVRLLGHPHPAVAHDAWATLWNLYYTKWQVYVERRPFRQVGDKPAVDGFFASARPIYYRTDRVYCRTVGEALMAIMYREKKWTVDYEGDWQAWWRANGARYR